jgi:hypothetical protein
MDETRSVELKEWSANRSQMKDTLNEIRRKANPDVARTLQGRVGGVYLVTTPPAEEVRTWYMTIFDMMRR